jgi:hypothetical protein
MALTDLPTRIKMYENEVLRMDEMLREFEQEKRQAVWSPLVGAVVAIPAYLWRPWAGAFALFAGVAIMGCWLYLTFGHIIERRYQRKLTLHELATLRAQLAQGAEAQAPSAGSSRIQP